MSSGTICFPDRTAEAGYPRLLLRRGRVDQAAGVWVCGLTDREGGRSQNARVQPWDCCWWVGGFPMYLCPLGMGRAGLELPLLLQTRSGISSTPLSWPWQPGLATNETRA